MAVLSTTNAIQNLNSAWFKSPEEAAVLAEIVEDQFDKYEIYEITERFGEFEYDC